MPRVFVGFVACAVLTLIALRVEAADVWTKNPNGWAYHTRSGLGCAPTLATKGANGARSVALSDVVVARDGQSAGDHVGCDYEGAGGIWASVEIAKLRVTDTVAVQAAAMDSRIQSQFPSAKRVTTKTSSHPASTGTVSTAIGRKPANPTGGQTFTLAFYDVKAGNDTAVIAVAGGDVSGWMLTLVQLDHGANAADLQATTVANWEALVAARLGGRTAEAR